MVREDWPIKTLKVPCGTTQACVTTSLRRSVSTGDSKRAMQTYQIEMSFLVSVSDTQEEQSFFRYVRSKPFGKRSTSAERKKRVEEAHLAGPWEARRPK